MFFFSLPLLKKWKPDVSPGFYIRLDELQDICEVQVAKSKGWNGLTGWRRGRWFFLHVHPWRLTWNIIMEVWKIIFVSKWVMAVGSMLIFQGVTFFCLSSHDDIFHCRWFLQIVFGFWMIFNSTPGRNDPILPIFSNGLKPLVDLVYIGQSYEYDSNIHRSSWAGGGNF